MISRQELEKIKGVTQEMLEKMTVHGVAVDVSLAADDLNIKESSSIASGDIVNEAEDAQPAAAVADIAHVHLRLSEPQILIGHNGQTLAEFERLLRLVVNKALAKMIYVKLDINDYRERKIEHLKSLARDTADEVMATGRKKTLPPMSSFERRVIHATLANAPGVTTQSEGEGQERCVAVLPK